MEICISFKECLKLGVTLLSQYDLDNCIIYITTFHKIFSDQCQIWRLGWRKVTYFCLCFLGQFLVKRHFISFEVPYQHIFSEGHIEDFIFPGGQFEDFIGGRCVFKESEWSEWNETAKDCGETTTRNEIFVLTEPEQTCIPRESTNETVFATGVCLGDD